MNMTASKAQGSQSTAGLANFPAYAKIPVSDIERAKRFYAERLGLMPLRETNPGHFQYQCGGVLFLLFPSLGRASGDHDQMGWFVDDIDAMVSELKGRGLVFEKFPDMPYGDTWTGDIADNGRRRAAWFRDC